MAGRGEGGGDSSFEEKEKHQSSSALFLRVLTRSYPQLRARQLLLSAACLTRE